MKESLDKMRANQDLLQKQEEEENKLKAKIVKLEKESELLNIELLDLNDYFKL